MVHQMFKLKVQYFLKQVLVQSISLGGMCLVLVFLCSLQTQTHTGLCNDFVYFFLVILYIACCCLMSCAVSFTIVLVQVPFMDPIHNSLNRPLPTAMKSCLLHGASASTRFATQFYAMHRWLKQKQVLKAKTHNPLFAWLPKNDFVAVAFNDFEDSAFWKNVWCLFGWCVIFKAMNYGNFNIPKIDIIYFWWSIRSIAWFAMISWWWRTLCTKERNNFTWFQVRIWCYFWRNK